MGFAGKHKKPMHLTAREELEDLAKEELVESSVQASVGLQPSSGGLEAAVGQCDQQSRR